jgi:hypothetical protein
LCLLEWWICSLIFLLFAKSGCSLRESLLSIHIWLFQRFLFLPIPPHRVWTARIAIATISISRCSLLLSILGTLKISKWF